MRILCTFVILAQIALLAAQAAQRPHILFIVADDLGWNDVSWHNPEIIMPNLERLARSGVILDRSYVQPMCTPSRNSFMTGLYPYHTGLQHFVILSDQPMGVPLNITMLPQILHDQGGYATHIVGKWHLGYCKWEYTPLRRGFQSFTGYYNGMEDYYTRMMGDDLYEGYDFRENETLSYADNGTYSAYTFANRAIDVINRHDTNEPLFLYLALQNVHEPIEVPSAYSDMYKYIEDMDRRKFCGMVTIMDEVIGNVTEALQARGMLDNTMILFTTDNGGPTYASANNWPLRGAKTTLWEGGTRGAAFISGPVDYLPKRDYTSHHLMHAVDWFPTILELAGLNVSDIRRLNYTLDGVSQLDALRNNVSVRSEFVYNIDDVDRNAAIRMGDYKLIVGKPGNYNDVVPPPRVGTLELHALRYDTVLPSDEEDEEEQEQEWSNSYDEWSSSKQSEQRLGKLANWLRMLDLDDCSESDSSTSYNEFVNSGKVRLYDVTNDPSETTDLSEQLPDVVARMLDRLNEYRKTMVPAQNSSATSKADPKYWNGAWSPGWC